MHIEFLKNITSLTEHDQLTLQMPEYPFLRFSFLKALESSGCCAPETGWHPHHVLWRDDEGRLLGFMPLYLKEHSWGEYVFDGSWAHAYQAHGLPYYPKMLTAIPFTPVPGPRILTSEGVDPEVLMQQWLHDLPRIAERLGVSGWHELFPLTAHQSHQTGQIHQPGETQTVLLERHDCQFHWFNHHYQNFDAVLADFTSRKRKNIRKERAGFAQRDITLHRIKGEAITVDLMDTFFSFYQNTYHIRGHRPHLNRAFFTEILTTMPDTLLLVIAEQQGVPFAGALFFFDSDTLYGRYWGTTADIPGLHFECCYYQGIEFCIDENISSFNPGTQGEHKISRGFEPTVTRSLHWIQNPQFSIAIADFLTQERAAVATYAAEAATLLPFKHSPEDRTFP